MRSEKRAPGRRPLTARRNALGLEDARNRRPGYTMPDIFQRPLDSRVAPARIVGHHADRQTPDLASYARSAGALPGVRPLAGDQLSVPSENRVGRDERGELVQRAATEPVSQHRQTPALSIVQSQPTAAQLHLQRAVLFAKVGDHIALLTIEPPKQRRQ